MKVESIDIQNEDRGIRIFIPCCEDFTYFDGYTVGYNTNAKVIDEFIIKIMMI